jgi:hypothetical protein
LLLRGGRPHCHFRPSQARTHARTLRTPAHCAVFASGGVSKRLFIAGFYHRPRARRAYLRPPLALHGQCAHARARRMTLLLVSIATFRTLFFFKPSKRDCVCSGACPTAPSHRSRLPACTGIGCMRACETIHTHTHTHT